MFFCSFYAIYAREGEFCFRLRSLIADPTRTRAKQPLDKVEEEGSRNNEIHAHREKLFTPVVCVNSCSQFHMRNFQQPSDRG